jgi:acetyltransferase-like isoleucine patch superfamily enzyme
MIKKLKLIIYYAVIARLPHSRYFEPINRIRLFWVCRVLKIMKYNRNSRFQNNIYIGHGDHVSIGDECQINGNVFIQGGRIGNYVMIAPDVAILSLVHHVSSTAIPMIRQGRRKHVDPIIEDDVWIGTRVVILPGIRIARGCIIGAGAVVTRDTQPYGIYGGVPAKLIRKRRMKKPEQVESTAPVKKSIALS